MFDFTLIELGITNTLLLRGGSAYVVYKNRKVVEIEIKTEQPAKPEEAPVAEEPTKASISAINFFMM